MDGLEEHQGSHLPQEQEYGAASSRMFMARILPLSLRSVYSVLPRTDWLVLLLLPRTDWLVLFQTSLLHYGRANSLF